MSAITTHILDTSRGCPATGVPIQLEIAEGEASHRLLGSGKTDEDGRLKTLLGDADLVAGTYRITFDTGAYFSACGVDSFYPQVSIRFVVGDASQHYHVPLLLNPFGFSTYRGS
jgi:5-hydroxyisourate hydrolase